jgi:hypothetical protein
MIADRNDGYRPVARARRWLPLGGALLLLLGAAAAQAQVAAVPARPMPPASADKWKAGKPSRTACIDVSTIAGAVVVDARTVDVVMRGGRRWRLGLAQQCPQLSYYGGFYYQPRVAGKFCAGEDRIISRAGGACRVSHISELKQVRPKR